MKYFYFILLFVGSLSGFAQGPFAPYAGAPGSTAISASSSNFIAWSSSVRINRGKQDVAVANSDTTSSGTWIQATGLADGFGVSLGDSGIATLQFDGRIYNGNGPDLAVFENAFNHTFLELAFVEVSSNGIDFHRFPNRSLTDTTAPVTGFGTIEATNIHNLAGKYTALYGTPFDLADLDSVATLDVNSISHVRIVDVIGTLNPAYAQTDTRGQVINDQYPTPFPSGGFDLDAVGVMHMKGVSIGEKEDSRMFSVYPNPASDEIILKGIDLSYNSFQIINVAGTVLAQGELTDNSINVEGYKSGYYYLVVKSGDSIYREKLIIQ